MKNKQQLSLFALLRCGSEFGFMISDFTVKKQICPSVREAKVVLRPSVLIFALFVPKGPPAKVPSLLWPADSFTLCPVLDSERPPQLLFTLFPRPYFWAAQWWCSMAAFFQLDLLCLQYQCPWIVVDRIFFKIPIYFVPQKTNDCFPFCINIAPATLKTGPLIYLRTLWRRRHTELATRGQRLGSLCYYPLFASEGVLFAHSVQVKTAAFCCRVTRPSRHTCWGDNGRQVRRALNEAARPTDSSRCIYHFMWFWAECLFNEEPARLLICRSHRGLKTSAKSTRDSGLWKRSEQGEGILKYFPDR